MYSPLWKSIDRHTQFFPPPQFCYYIFFYIFRFMIVSFYSIFFELTTFILYLMLFYHGFSWVFILIPFLWHFIKELLFSRRGNVYFIPRAITHKRSSFIIFNAWRTTGGNYEYFISVPYFSIFPQSQLIIMLMPLSPFQSSSL